MDFLIFAAAVGLLVYGAEIVIKESERIAFHFNISSFVIGASLVAFGTSLPELAASVQASYDGKSDIAVSNVLGSVILNIAIILGIVFVISKNLMPKRDLFNLDSAWIFIPVGLFVLIVFDGTISRVDGVILLALMAAYLVFLAQDSNLIEEEIDEELKSSKFNWLKTVVLLFIGFVLVIKGAEFTVDSASSIARTFGVSEWIIGLLLLAFGTSLPELVVSVKAALNGNAEMSIGNIIGSNVANFSMVLGTASLVNPLTLNLQATMFDIAATIVVSFIFIFVLANRLYNRSTGIIFLSVALLVITNAFK
ncbi:MAG: cation:H+ antiporter [Campylobacterota bacterium]|nr:cation:H+ antiporter [Campylobacterota bacterium]